MHLERTLCCLIGWCACNEGGEIWYCAYESEPKERTYKVLNTYIVICYMDKGMHWNWKALWQRYANTFLRQAFSYSTQCRHDSLLLNFKTMNIKTNEENLSCLWSTQKIKICNRCPIVWIKCALFGKCLEMNFELNDWMEFNYFL